MELQNFIALGHWAARNGFTSLANNFFTDAGMENVNESLVSEAKLRMSMSVLVNIVETCDYNSRKSFKSILAAFTQFESQLKRERIIVDEFEFLMVKRSIVAQMCVKLLLKQLSIYNNDQVQQLTPDQIVFRDGFCFREYMTKNGKIFEQESVNNVYTQAIRNDINASQSLLDCDVAMFTYDLLYAIDNDEVMSKFKVLSAIHIHSLAIFQDKIKSLVYRFEFKHTLEPELIFVDILSNSLRNEIDMENNEMISNFSDEEVAVRNHKARGHTVEDSVVVTPEKVWNRHKPNMFRSPPTRYSPDGKRIRVVWEKSQVQILVKGVKEYGEGKWVQILEDDRFKEALSNMDNKQLKDKYRNLKKKGNPLYFENIEVV